MTDVEYRTGDLFDQTDAGAWAHGVNCVGVMGGGIAKAFRIRYNDMYPQYRMQCHLGVLTLGGVFAWKHVGTGRVIFNIGSQHLPGPHAKLDALEQGLMTSAAMADRLRIESIAMPRIGAGIGGLDWDDAKDVIESVAKHVPTVKLIVVSL